MEKAPKALRLHLALMGRVNSGKSSFLNLVAGQNVSITSAQEGTTTDVVEKAQELLPLGPIVWLDTAGYGDKTGLAAARLGKTKSVWERADVIVLVCEGNQIGEEEQRIIDEAAARKLPLIKIFNKALVIRDFSKLKLTGKFTSTLIVNSGKNKIELPLGIEEYDYIKKFLEEHNV